MKKYLSFAAFSVFAVILSVFTCSVCFAAAGPMYAYQPAYGMQFEVYNFDGGNVFRTLDGYFVTRNPKGEWIYVYYDEGVLTLTQLLVGSVKPASVPALNRPNLSRYKRRYNENAVFLSSGSGLGVGTLLVEAKTVAPTPPYYADVMTPSGIVFDFVTAENGVIVKFTDPRLIGIDIKPGDIITELNGRTLAGKAPEWARDYIDARLKAGNSVVLTYARGGEMFVGLLRPRHEDFPAKQAAPAESSIETIYMPDNRDFPSNLYLRLRKMNGYKEIAQAYRAEKIPQTVKNDYSMWTWRFRYNEHPLIVYTSRNRIRFTAVLSEYWNIKEVLKAFDDRVKEFTKFFGASPTRYDSSRAEWLLITGETFVIDTMTHNGYVYYCLYPDYDPEVVNSSRNFLTGLLK